MMDKIFFEFKKKEIYLKSVTRLLVVALALVGNVSLAKADDASVMFTVVPVIASQYGVRINSNLVIEPSTVFRSESTDVVAAISMTGKGNSTKAELWETDKDGNLLQQVGNLQDNGDVNSGDYLEGDGIYHCKLTLTPETDEKRYYRAIYSHLKSENVVVSVVPKIPDTSLVAASEQAGTAKSVYETQLGGGGTPEEAQTAVQTMLASEQNILQYGKANDNYGSWWITDEGIIVIHDPLTENSDEKSRGWGHTPVKPLPVNAGTPVLPSNFSSAALKLAESGGKTSKTGVKAVNKRIGSKDALLLDVYAFNDENPHIETTLSNYGMTVKRVLEGNATLDNFKNLSKYGVVAISSHGSSYFSELKVDLLKSITWWDEEWGQLNEGGWPTISTPLLKTDDMKADIAAGRLAVRSSGKVSILPAFISHYNKNLPDTIVWMSICQGAYNDKLGNAFTLSGASAFFGFSDTVKASFAKTHGEGLFDHLILDQTAATYSGIGEDDGDTTPAKLRLIGDGNIRLIDPSILENGDFETGNLISWSPVGDVRVVQKLQQLNSPQGTYMGLLTTGVGASSESTSSLSQKIRPSVTKHVLKLKYNFVSEEPMEWVDSSYDDRFQIFINSEPVTVESVNNAEWKQLGGDYFQGGDKTTFHTGWKEYTVDLTSYIGTMVDLEFRVSDVGDSAWDSAILIDSIRLE